MGRKHCGKRRNCSSRAISPFPTVFQKACFPGASKGAIVWEWVNPFPNKPSYLRVCSTRLLKTLWEKEKLLVTSNFSFSHSVFYLFEELSAILIKFEIVVCKLFQFERDKNLSSWKGLKARLITFFKTRLIKFCLNS